jgi:hypothetical protein
MKKYLLFNKVEQRDFTNIFIPTLTGKTAERFLKMVHYNENEGRGSIDFSKEIEETTYILRKSGFMK